MKTKLFGDGDSWVNWQVLPASLTDEEIKTLLSYDFDFEGSHYSGPGQSFYNRASIRRTGTRVLVTQWGGLDV